MGSTKLIVYPEKKPPQSTSQNERMLRYLELAAVALNPHKSSAEKKSAKGLTN
jgi:hypothetical protein